MMILWTEGHCGPQHCLVIAQHNIDNVVWRCNVNNDLPKATKKAIDFLQQHLQQYVESINNMIGSLERAGST